MEEALEEGEDWLGVGLEEEDVDGGEVEDGEADGVLLVEVVGEALGEAEESSEESPLFSAMIAMTAMSITTMTAAIAPIMRPVFGPFFFGCPPYGFAGNCPGG